MTRKEKIVWSLLAGVLVLLFLLSSTDLIIKEKKTEIYPVSVIIRDTTDDYFSNFRKGVDKAAVEYNVDVNFITLYEKRDARAQMELLKREINDGAKAVVFMPLKPVECGAILDEMVINSPLIIMGNMYPNDWVMGGISQDYQEAGRLLGEAIIQENTAEKPVFLFTEGLEYGYNQEVYDGLENVLSEAGFQMRLYEKYKEGYQNHSQAEEDDIFRRAIEETVYPGSGEAIIAALDIESLEATADIIAGSPVYGKYVPGLYGIGSTTKLLNQMDRGVIKGLVVTNQFDAGYLSIVKAVQAIRKSGEREQTMLESYYIEKSDLRDSRFEKILYPIE